MHLVLRRLPLSSLVNQTHFMWKLLFCVRMHVKENWSGSETSPELITTHLVDNRPYFRRNNLVVGNFYIGFIKASK